ncbi:hypothetical protein COB21_02380 [Candidatus Aerophobetes bacterium]|uniref:Uncharacterized protein n=1 Tax=Aerophobetes bacterium TaxID=2030807 RepID=A0A2A4X5E5_UNCAE|nr:MAG: hypothetical protein COB21_02380 [Candidatus Aerophobetes bacterium]
MSAGIALFGEAQRGNFSRLVTLHTLEKLHDTFGMPPPLSKGIWLSIQLLMQNEIIYFYRIEEEGFSYPHYHEGLKLLDSQQTQYPLKALCMPGLGDRIMVGKATEFCKKHSIIFLCTEEDFYDYVTCF